MKTAIFIIGMLLTIVACTTTQPKSASKDLLNDVNFGWNSEYDSISHKLEFNKAWAGRGWWFGDDNGDGTSVDFSDYDLVVVKVSDIQGKTEKVQLSVYYPNSDVVSCSASSATKGTVTIRVELDSLLKSHVFRIALQSDSIGSLVIQEAKLQKKVKYGEPKELEINELGIIPGNQFDGYSDDARIDFVFNAEGEMTGIDDFGEEVSTQNWGIGVICSVADILGETLPKHYIFLSKLGEQSYSCTLGDIRDLLSLADDDGERGIYWTVWTVGNLTDISVVRTTIAEKE